ncbi:hypothetical protein [Pectobacterium jejuense]|uniref:hypothetical protein n=1 Tax=Pectobacterium jejuense TaxID=2974022 RepID=UPI003D9A6736
MLLRLLNQGDYAAAADQFPRWEKMVSKSWKNSFVVEKQRKQFFYKPSHQINIQQKLKSAIS